MTLPVAQLADPLGLIIGFLLTIMVFSYIIGDNVLFRLAIHIFIGVASGYAAVVIIYNVLWYQVLVPVLQMFTADQSMANSTYILEVVPAVILGIWMLTKVSPRLARWGTPVLAFITGVGAATTIGGAVLGTILPQVSASANVLNITTAPTTLNSMAGWFINGLIIVLGTITTLIYFQFGKSRQEDGQAEHKAIIMEYVTSVGQGFIMVTLGVLFASVYIASLTALIDRIRFLWDFILRFI